MKNQRKAYGYAITSVLLWSTVATAFKISLKNYDYVQLLLFSSVTATIALFLLILAQNKIKLLFDCKKTDLFKSATNGFLNPFLYYLVLLKAYSILPAQIAQPLNYTWPIVLVFLSVPLLNQKISIKSYVALIISFLGVIIISTQGQLTNFKISEPIGIVLATGSSIIWSLYWIFNIKDKRDEVIKLFLNFLFGTIYTIIAIPFISKFKLIISINFLSLIYVGLFEMGITFVFWLKAMRYTISNDKIGNLVFLSPFISLLFITLILKEQIYYSTIIGLVFIILGILLQQKKTKQTSERNT